VSWETSDRKSRLPKNWPQLVAKVKKRAGGRCEWRLPRSGKRCPRDGVDVDHIRNNDNHDLSNLRLLCETHHDRKSSGEGRKARADKRALRFRPPPQHPGRVL
jgi:5-methylcytosine-specific restriction protein A